MHTSTWVTAVKDGVAGDAGAVSERLVEVTQRKAGAKGEPPAQKEPQRKTLTCSKINERKE